MSVREIKTGQDSFLDIVANLVGVLIILVVLVGAGASATWVDNVASVDTSELTELETLVERTESSANKVEIDNHLLEEKIDSEVAHGMSLQKRRHQLLVGHENAQRKIDALKSTLTGVERDTIERTAELESLKKQLADLETERTAIQHDAAPRKETIKHYPTPIARTVFTDEIHFRLYNDRLMYVPMEELVELMKAELPGAAEKLENASATTETVGPVGGFRLQYELQSETVREDSGFGPLERRIARFDRFVILPINENGGDPVRVALSERSAFRELLSRHAPRRTTISIWVYPESYDSFNELKDWLREEGYQTAGWPLAEGRPISGGPGGFRTSAQ